MRHNHNYKKPYNKKKHTRKKKDKFTGLSVEVYNNNVEQALRKLKKMVKNAKLIPELRRREFYRKPSDIRREKNALGKLRARQGSKNT